MRCNKMVDDSMQVCPVCGSNKFRTAQAKKPVRPPRPQGGMQNNQQGMGNMNMSGMGSQQYNNGGYNQQYDNGNYNQNMGMNMNNGNMNMSGMGNYNQNMSGMSGMSGMGNYSQNMGMNMNSQQMNMNNGNMNMGNQQQTQNIQQQAPQKKEKKKKMSRKEKMQLEMEQMRQIQEARAKGLPDPVFDNGQAQNANQQYQQKRGQVNNNNNMNMGGMQGNMQNMGNRNTGQQRFQDVPVNSGESSVKQWIITLVITAIPILNIVYCIMIMKNNNAEGYRRDFAKAFLIYLVIAFVVSLVIGNMLVSRLS